MKNNLMKKASLFSRFKTRIVSTYNTTIGQLFAKIERKKKEKFWEKNIDCPNQSKGINCIICTPEDKLQEANICSLKNCIKGRV